jgi:hypothetical protein
MAMLASAGADLVQLTAGFAGRRRRLRPREDLDDDLDAASRVDDPAAGVAASADVADVA